ncbi:SusC/RagA family TonB-linked outer membrane protein [Muricauda brasiliensis]|uniref:SusC/RagA family TonB-linked outer membrane protein n=1 Tax=Muricauda brasiliensis TaxID=2162892 RepID=UPI000D36BF3F|nr:SusC/RagA family TonB-linked outer membrane protein [Muricauda brasiliensis]
MKAKNYGMLLVFLMCLCATTLAQEKNVTGTVTDQNGLPLPGVSIMVVGTTNGAQTNFDGNYSIMASTGQTLRFSYIGQATVERTVGSSPIINVQMEDDAQALEEVVVTALGVQRDPKSLAYSAPKVNSEELNSAQNNNAISALSGKVAGLKINSPSGNLDGSQRILIRGTNSITGENQPLFVIDGIPMDNSNFNTTNAQRGAGGVDFGSTINDIDPNSIESVTVLKGAAAALYGSRASNGVVLITTKSGKSSKKLGVTINTSVAMSQVAILPNLQREYGGGSIISDEDGGINGFETVNINNTQYLIPQYAVDESWGPKYDPNVMVLHWDAFDQSSFPEDYLKPRPWVAPANDVDSFFNTGVSINNNVTVTTGGDKGSTLMSIGNQNTTGILPGSEIKKHFIRMNLKQQLSEKWLFTSNLNYVKSQGIRPTIGYDDNSVTQKFFQWGQRQLDYDRLRNYKNNDGSQRTWNRIAWNDPTPNYSDNPYWTAFENYPTDTRSRIYGAASLNYMISDDLGAKLSVYGDTYNFRNTEQKAIGSQAQSSYLERTYDFQEYNYEFTLNYNKDITDNFGINALAGANQRDYQLDYRAISTTGGLALPGIFNINNGNGPLNKATDTELKKVNSLFGSLNLSVADQIFIDMTARNDWSSTLPNDKNSYFYPSAALAWVFSETFAKDSNWFSYGKLRAGWAQVGNDANPYDASSTLSVLNPFNGEGRATAPNTLQNVNLKNEITETWEVGAELSFLRNRFNLDVTYYNNSTTDQIIPVNLSLSTGYAAQWINAGEMTNKGIEVQVGVKPIMSEDFSWEFNVNYAKNENELVKLTEGLETINLTSAPFRAQLVATEGQSYGVIMGTDFIYDDAGNKVITPGGAYAATPDLVPLGSVLPDYTGGLRNTFRYKNVDLSFLLEMSKGGKYFSTTHQWGMYSGMLQETVDNNIREEGIVLDGVTGTITYDENGDYTVTDTAENTTTISAQEYGTNHYGGFGTPDAQNVFNADFIKLREITLGYTFKNLADIFESARISFFGRNMFTWGLDYDGIDPETVSTGSGNIQGLEGGLQPSIRTYGMNVQLSF